MSILEERLPLITLSDPNIQKQVINLIDPCFFDPVAKVFGTVITGSDEWIYHIHNVL